MKSAPRLFTAALRLAAAGAIATAALTAVAAPAATPALPKSPNAPQIDPALLKGVVQRPDLTVMSIQPRMLGATPYAYVCVKNTGPVAAGAFDVQLTMGAAHPTGSPPISWITLVGTIRYPNVPANGGFTCNDFKLPGQGLPNCVKYTAKADVRSEISESNEANNTREHLGGCLGEPPHPASSPKFGAQPTR